MAEVPVYGSPKSKTNALPGYRQSGAGASAEAFAGNARQIGQLGEALGNVGQAVLSAADKKAEQDATAELFRAEQYLNENTTAWSDQASAQRQGANAAGYADEAADHYDKIYTEASQMVRSERAKRVFEHSAGKARNAFVTGARRHQLREEEKAQDAAYSGVLDSLRMSGISDPSPENLARVLEDGHSRIAAQARLKGLPAEAVQAETRKWETELHAANVMSMLNNNPKGAVEYLGTHGEFMEPKIAADLKDKAMRGATVADIEAKVAPLVAARRPLDEVQKAARELAEPGYEDIAEQAANKVYSQRKQIDTDNANRVFDQIAKYANKNGGSFVSVPESLVITLGVIDPSRELAVRTAQRRELENMAANGTRYSSKDDAAARDALLERAASGDITPDDLPLMAPSLTKKTFEALQDAVSKQAVVPSAKILEAFEKRKKKSWDKMTDGERDELVAFQSFVYGDVKENMQPKDLDLLADRWFMQGAWLSNNSVFPGVGQESSTFGQARMDGRETFAQPTPPIHNEAMQGATELLRAFNSKYPEQGVGIDDRANRAQFKVYTDYGFDAVRWLERHRMDVTPAGVAAYAILKKNGYPLVEDNFAAALSALEESTAQPAK